MARLDLAIIDIPAELNRLGWAFETTTDTYKCQCPNPLHADKNPSCSLYRDSATFKCHVPSCGMKGDFITFMALASGKNRRDVTTDLQTRYNIVLETDVVDVRQIEEWAGQIENAGDLLQALYARGLDDTIIQSRRIGYDGKRITIPVYDKTGRVVNVRKYLPGAPSSQKMRNLVGHAVNRLYPIDQLRFPTIFVCGGEMKAVATAARMNALDFGAISTTAGEGSWEESFTATLAGKHIIICMDIDGAGRKAAEAVASKLHGKVKSLSVLHLPLDPAKYPAGDLNDYWAQRHTPQDLLALVGKLLPWTPHVHEDPTPAPSTAVTVHLAEMTSAKYASKAVNVGGVITAKDETPYVVTKDVMCQCERNQTFCSICPVYAATPQTGHEGMPLVQLTISAQNPLMLSMIEASAKQQRDLIRQALGIPTCKSVSFKSLSFYNIEDLRLVPQLQISSTTQDSVTRPAYFIGHGLEMNIEYEFSGRVWPHPKDQHAVLLAHEAKPAVDSLSAFSLSPEDAEALDVFRPRAWTTLAVADQLRLLYDDLADNVTRIYGRQDMHLTIDLAYHSPILLRINKRDVKGWVEVLILGDSAQGKTEAASGLQRHYGLGERVDCKGLSEAGIKGGLVNSGKRWFVTWGILPLQDRRLAFLEEMKGMRVEVIGSLTDMRSSGVAELTKIEKRRTHARTRIVGISNPRTDRPLSAYAYPVEAVKELIGSLEDVRRFDMVYIAAAGQVPVELMNEEREKVEHRFTAKLCRNLVLWAWTRRADQVVFTPEADAEIVTGALALSSKFTDTIPIVDSGSMRFKIARLAASLAARTFSTNETRDTLIVHACHVAYIVAFLDRLYSDSTSGYLAMSEAVRARESIQDVPLLRKAIAEVPFAQSFVEQMLTAPSVEFRDISDWTGYEHESAREILGLFVRKNCLVRDGNGYRKTPAFIRFLRELKDLPERPGFVQEELRKVVRDL